MKSFLQNYAVPCLSLALALLVVAVAYWLLKKRRDDRELERRIDLWRRTGVDERDVLSQRRLLLEKFLEFTCMYARSGHPYRDRHLLESARAAIHQMDSINSDPNTRFPCGPESSPELFEAICNARKVIAANK